MKFCWKSMKGLKDKYFTETNLIYLEENIGFHTHLVCAEATPAPSLFAKSKNKTKNVHFCKKNDI